jgi:hypothetical protein
MSFGKAYQPEGIKNFPLAIIESTNYQTYRLVFQYDNKVDLLFQVEKDGFHGI